MKFVITILAIIVIGGAFVLGNYVTYKNKAVVYENKIPALYEDNQNVLGQYTTKIMEMAQVNDMYRDDVKDIYKGVMEGRYGENGSKAMWQWLQEQNPQIDASLYGRLQQVMEAGRNEFKIAQTKLIDVKREYKSQLDFVWSGLWMSLADYPKINIGYNGEDDYPIIQSTASKKTFESGIDDGVKIR